MSKPNIAQALLVGLSALTLASCENLPGSKGTQGAVIGGASGAAVGAAVGGERHRVLGAVLGGAVGTAGGYVIGANSDKILNRDRTGAEDAVRRSEQTPSTAADARRATTADVNGDGFVTLDEVVAMKSAGFNDTEMLERMRTTGQVFELTADQRRYLIDRGVSSYVVDRMEDINRDERQRIITAHPEIIGRPPVAPPRY